MPATFASMDTTASSPESGTVPSAIVPSKNSTEPVIGAPAGVGVTVAISRSGRPTTAGFAVAVSVVVVAGSVGV